MTTKSELAAANEALMAEDRAKAGGAPTADEMLAFTRGELSGEEAERIRERLVAYPDLVRTLTAPFPEGAEPDDADYLSEHEFARHWAALQKRGQRPDSVPFWRAFAAIAATVAVVFGGLLWHERMESRKPHLLTYEALLPDGQRGIGGVSTTLTPAGDFFLLVVSVNDDYKSYRAEIVDFSNPSRTLWPGETVARRDDGSLIVLIPRSFLKPGTYKLIVYGINGARQDALNSYTLRVPPR